MSKWRRSKARNSRQSFYIKKIRLDDTHAFYAHTSCNTERKMLLTATGYTCFKKRTSGINSIRILRQEMLHGGRPHTRYWPQWDVRIWSSNSWFLVECSCIIDPRNTHDPSQTSLRSYSCDSVRRYHILNGPVSIRYINCRLSSIWFGKIHRIERSETRTPSRCRCRSVGKLSCRSVLWSSSNKDFEVQWKMGVKERVEREGATYVSNDF